MPTTWFWTLPMQLTLRLRTVSSTTAMKLPSCLFALSLFAATVCGQTTAAVTPHAVLETVGPDGWRMRLGPTNLGSLLESEKGHELWQQGALPILAFWQQMLGDEAAFVASKARVLGYGGRIRVGLWVEPDKFSRQRLAHLALVLEGDGRTDLGALAKDLRLLQTRLADGEWGETEVGGTMFDLCKKGEDVMTAPLAETNSLFVVMSNRENFSSALAAGRAFAATATGKAPPPNSPALRIQVDLPALVAMGMKGSDRDAEMMQKLGLSSLGPCEFSVGTAGPHVRLEIAQEFVAGAERGLFDAFLPATAGVPALRRGVPAGPGSWKVGHFDFLALYLTIEKALATVNQTANEVRAEAKKELGVDIVDDLLAHLTDDVLLITSPVVQLERPEDFTWTLAIRLRDEAAFGKSLLTAIEKGKPFLQREATQKIGDVEIHRYGSMFGYDVLMGVGHGSFVLAGGRDAEAQITGLLEALKSMPTAVDATAKNPGFDDLQRHLPPGCNGLAVGDIGSLVAIPARVWFGILGELTPLRGLPGLPRDEEDDPEQREAVLELLKKHGLATLRSATGYAERTWRWRLFW
jgi:hypothetical protein